MGWRITVFISCMLLTILTLTGCNSIGRKDVLEPSNTIGMEELLNTSRFLSSLKKTETLTSLGTDKKITPKVGNVFVIAQYYIKNISKDKVNRDQFPNIVLLDQNNRVIETESRLNQAYIKEGGLVSTNDSLTPNQEMINSILFEVDKNKYEGRSIFAAIQADEEIVKIPIQPK